MPDVYEGNRPYIFVSYAHADDDAVLPLLEALVAQGYRVWWDKGVELAEPFPDYIAKHVVGCACFVPLISRASLVSAWCCKEIEFANKYRKHILPVFLEDVELSLGLDLQIGSLQSLYRLAFDSDAEFYGKLFGAKVLDSCLTAEGARRRGVKARGSQAREAVPQSQHVVQAGPSIEGVAPVRASVVFGVETRAKLANYSWDDLKKVSQAIAAAGSDEAGLKIAKSYHLVDGDGKLQGDEKPFKLKGGGWTSVRVLGFRHDELAEGGRAGISFEFADVPARHRMNPTDTNKGGWEKSEMRRWLNDEFPKLLPDGLRANVAEARKRTNNRGSVLRENDTAVVTGTADRLWLLSTREVYGGVPSWVSSPATYDAEGAQYQLYADKGVSTTNYGPCRKRGADSWWWLRSPYAHDSLGFHSVHIGGVWLARCASGGWGVSPGFCF